MRLVYREYKLRLIAPVQSLYLCAALVLTWWHYRRAGWPTEKAHQLAALIAQMRRWRILTPRGWRNEAKLLRRWCSE